MKRLAQKLSRIINGQLKEKIPKASKKSHRPSGSSKKVINGIKRSIKTTGYRSVSTPPTTSCKVG